MQKLFSTKRICRAGVIAALYIALNFCFGTLSTSGFVQIRPAEALTLLPLFFPEAVPALFIGCILGNLFSPYGVWDICLGAGITLLASLCTYFVGKLVRPHPLKVLIGGFFPVLLNALLLPLLFVFLYGDFFGQHTATAAYFTLLCSMLITQTVWVYGLGSIAYYTVYKTVKK